MNVFFTIGEDRISYNFDGDVEVGEDKVILNEDINLLENSDFKDIGYKILPFLDVEKFNTIKTGLTSKIQEIMKSIGIDTDKNFELEDYHHFMNDEKHLELAKIIQHGWHVSEFPIDFKIIDQEISKAINFEVSTNAPHINFNNFFIRIIRPGKISDNNPPHRDVWIDRLRNAINIYFPICGSNDKSSLPLMPKSHLVSEKNIERSVAGAFLNNTKYTVPCVIRVNGEEPKLIRPNVKEEQVMIFSPYLVHGGGANLNKDKTRVSLEVRFFPKNLDLSQRI
jgi:hypothetical protein